MSTQDKQRVRKCEVLVERDIAPTPRECEELRIPTHLDVAFSIGSRDGADTALHLLIYLKSEKAAAPGDV